MLTKEKGYLLGKRKIVKHTHNLFVDDLKLFATNRATLMKQLDIVTTFSENIGMKFGEDKCAYLQIERGEIVQNEEPIINNQLTINPVKIGDCYRQLGVNENVEFIGPINKDRTLKEYTNRVRKIWSSKLLDYDKVTAYNCFAISIITPTAGVVNWTTGDIKQIDIKTRKFITMTGNFHPNRDIDKLYIDRKSGSRGLRSIKIVFESRLKQKQNYALYS